MNWNGRHPSAAQAAGEGQVGRELLQHQLRDRVQLHEGGSLVDLPDLGVAEELFHRVLLHVPVAPEDLEAAGGAVLGHLGPLQLRNGGLACERLPGLLEPRGVVDGQPGALDLHVHPRKVVLDGLELGDGLSELEPLLRVRGGGVERGARDADHLGADADPPFVQGLDGDLVPLADRPDDVLLRNLEVLERERERGGGADTELVLFLSPSKPFHPDSTRKAVIPLYPFEKSAFAKTRKSSASRPFVIQSFPPFRTQRSPFFSAVVFEREGVRARAGLGEGEGAEHAAGKLRQVFAVDLRIPPQHTIVAGRRRRWPPTRPPAPAPRSAGAARKMLPPAPELLRDLDPHQAKLEELRDDVDLRLRACVHLVDVGADLGLREFADRAFGTSPLPRSAW